MTSTPMGRILPAGSLIAHTALPTLQRHSQPSCHTLRTPTGHISAALQAESPLIVAFSRLREFTTLYYCIPFWSSLQLLSKPLDKDNVARIPDIFLSMDIPGAVMHLRAFVDAEQLEDPIEHLWSWNWSAFKAGTRTFGHIGALIPFALLVLAAQEDC